MLRIAPVGRLDRIGPQPNRRGVAIEPVVGDDIVLPVLDGDAGVVSAKIVPHDFGLVGIAAPHAVLAAPGAVRDDLVAAERCLDAVRRRITHVVAVEQVVVRPAGPRVHRRLSGPEKDAIAAVRQRVERDDVA